MCFLSSSAPPSLPLLCPLLYLVAVVDGVVRCRARASCRSLSRAFSCAHPRRVLHTGSPSRPAVHPIPFACLCLTQYAGLSVLLPYPLMCPSSFVRAPPLLFAFLVASNRTMPSTRFICTSFPVQYPVLGSAARAPSLCPTLAQSSSCSVVSCVAPHSHRLPPSASSSSRASSSLVPRAQSLITSTYFFLFFRPRCPALPCCSTISSSPCHTLHLGRRPNSLLWICRGGPFDPCSCSFALPFLSPCAVQCAHRVSFASLPSYVPFVKIAIAGLCGPLLVYLARLSWPRPSFFLAASARRCRAPRLSRWRV